MNRIVDNQKLILDVNPLRGEKLTLEAQTKDGCTTIALDGYVTSACANEVGDEILAFLSAGQNIRLNLGKVRYFAPEAVSTLLKIQRNYVDNLTQTMILCNLTPELMDLFRKNHYIYQFAFEN